MYICTIVDMTKTKTIFRISQSETDLVLKVGTQAPHNFQSTGGQILLLLHGIRCWACLRLGMREVAVRILNNN